MVAEAAVAHLSRSGFEVLRNGRYFGEPTEQIYPDWYVLIATPAGFDDVTEKLAIALSQLGIQASRSLATRDQILMEELFSARSAVAFERAELAKARLELAELHDATSEIPKLRESLDLAQVEIVRLSEEISQAHKSKTRPLLPAQPIDKRTGSRVGAEVLDILAVVFPRIKLIRNSIDVIVFEFSSRKGIYRCLQALQSSNQGIPVSWKVLKGIDGWIECHVSNGQDDAGRAYARVNRVDRSWDVLVSHKSDQLRDIAWLDSQ
jgi:hypothetical protein